jgi:apolipoprotein N-acyltransferase
MFNKDNKKCNNLESRNEVKIVSKLHFSFRCFALLCLGVLLILAFPCFNYSFLAWIGIIPLYLLVIDLKWNRAFIAGFVWGYGWSIASIFWLRNIEPFVPYALSFILAFFYAFWALAVPLVRKYLYLPPKVQLKGYEAVKSFLDAHSFHVKELLLVLFLACWWCLLEWLRTWIFTGFPWNLLAITQWRQLGIIQIASITGIYGVSFLIIFMNLAIANTGINIYKKIKYNLGSNGFRTITLSLYTAILLILLAFYFGICRAEETNMAVPKVNLKVGVVQGDIPQIRFYSEEEAEDALKIYTELSEKILPAKPDILIWPESAVPQPLRGGGWLSLKYRNNLAYLIRTYKTPILLGSIDYSFKNNDQIEFYNSAFLLNKSGKIAEKYNKMHLVPWGEYTPFENLFPFKYFYPWIKKTFGMGRSCTPGTRNVVFDLKKNVRASVLICYEDVFPNIGREHVLNGANLLVTITNDAWFPTKDELEQHMAQAVFRAVENNRPMIRNGNCAGTCVIHPNGMITNSIFFKKNSAGELVSDPAHKGRGTAVYNLSIDKNPKLTFYTIYGDVFILVCGMIALIIFLWCLWCWKDKKNELLKLSSEK